MSKQNGKKPPVPFDPKGYVKATVYIGSGDALVKAISEDMERTGLKFSPLMIHAFKLYHNLAHGIEPAAEKRGMKVSELINQAVAKYLRGH